MTAPTFTAPPTVPVRTMDKDTFNTTVAAFLTWMKQFGGTELPAGVTWIDDTATQVGLDLASAAADALSAASNAAAAEAAATAAAGSASTSAGFKSTSTSTLTVGSGAKSGVIGLAKSFQPGGGDFVVFADASAPTLNWMTGQIADYNPATGAIDFTVAAGDYSGSGTLSNWTVTLCGKPGPPGGSAFTGGSLTTPVNYAPEATVASAATCNIFGASSNYLQVTGTTTITACDTVASSALRIVEFAAALTLTHSANLILPGAANIVTGAGDVGIFVSEGGGVTRCIGYMVAARGPVAGAAPDVIMRASSGGPITQAAWNDVVLNATDRNAGSLAALASNQITLPAGTYYAKAKVSVQATSSGGAATQARLFNVTDSAVVGAAGMPVYVLFDGTDNASGGAAPEVTLVFTLAASKALKLQVLGPSAVGANEIAAFIEIWKVG